MIIEVLDSKETPEGESIDHVVAKTVECLVEHYRQPIHALANDEDEEHSDDADLPPVLAFHAQEVRKNEELDMVLIVQALLVAYKDRIRPILWTESLKFDPSAKSLLRHYKRLVSHLYNSRQADDKTAVRLDADALDETLVALAQDVTLATAQVPDEQVRIVSLLLQLLYLTLELAAFDKRISLEQSTLCLTVATILSFGMPRQDDAMAQERLYKLRPYFVETPFPFDQEIRLDPLPTVTLDNFVWDNAAANAIIERIWRCKYWDRHVRQSSTEGDDDDNDDDDAPLSTRQQAILQHLTTQALTTAMRAHFFGHDMPTPTALQKTQLFMGKVVPKRSNDAEKPFLRVPSRVPSALHYILLLQSLDDPLTEAIWDNLAPILYELLAALSEAVNGLAALAVVRLLQHEEQHQHQQQRQSFLLASPIFNNLLLALDRVLQTCRDGPVLALVGLAQCELLRNMALAACAVYGDTDDLTHRLQRLTVTRSWLAVLETNRHRSNQKDLILSNLLTLIQLLHQFGGGGCDKGHCDELAVDLGQPLLQALLPLLQPDFGSEWIANSEDIAANQGGYRIQQAALVALLNGMIVSFPIVCRHASKVMSSCLALACYVRTLIKEAGESSHKGQVLDSFLALAIHVAAIALILTADKGQAVLTDIGTKTSSYDGVVAEILNRIRERTQLHRKLMR